MLERATFHAAELGLSKLEFVRVKDHRLPFADSSFDVVSSALSFRYLDWEKILPEILRVLKPEGRFLMVDMAAHPEDRTVLQKTQGLFFALSGRLRTLAYELTHPIYRRALRTLVVKPEWKAMLANNPTRGADAYSSALRPAFPGARLETLDQSLRARTVAFDSGPVGAATLHGLAVLDWGIGGAGFFQAIKQAYPDRCFSYVSDAGFEPYGKVPHRALVKRLGEIISFLHKRGVRALVVACNAMSTALGDPRLRVPEGFAVCGVIAPTIEALLSSPETSNTIPGGTAAGDAAKPGIAVIGGRRTIESGVYKKALEPRYGHVAQSVGQGLSALIEAGKMETVEFRETLTQVLAPLEKPARLVLACTHYPAARHIVAELLPETKLYDPVDYTLAYVRERFVWPRTGPAHDVFMTTGDVSQTRESARAAFGLEMDTVIQLPLGLDEGRR